MTKIHPRLVLITGPPGTGKSTLASELAGVLGAPVLGWDWAMAALTGFSELQDVLRDYERVRSRSVGWSILRNLALAQLREGRSVILDGVARDLEIDAVRETADDAGARLDVVVTRCSDVARHRGVIADRERRIPGWHELDWEHVEGFLDRWEEPVGADLVLDAAEPLTDNVAALRDLVLAQRE